MSNIVLLGSPGSGKGTIAHHLHSEANYIHVSTGDILRGEIQKQSPLGLQANQFISEGKLVPDDLMFEVIRKFVDAEREKLLFDGFPRTLPQAKTLQEFVRVQVAFFIDVSEDVAFKRITGRMRCSSCEQLYNQYYKPPRRKSHCDRCGGKLVRRMDDSEVVIRHRLRVFNATKRELLDFYKQRNMLITLNGEGTESQIQREVFGLLQGKPQSPSA